jgi:uncharacterized protein YxjI
MKKDQVLDAKGEVVGRYKSKKFSLAGGFHVYDKEGKHLAEIQGKMLKAEYKFVMPTRPPRWAPCRGRGAASPSRC